jgi:ATP synthase F1 delta subunit
MKKLNTDARNFVSGIVDQLRKNSKNDRPLPKVQSLLKKVSEGAWKDSTAKVTTAISLLSTEKEQISVLLSRRLGHPVNLVCTVSPKIIGGIKIEIADLLIDLSYEEKLQTIEAMLLKGNQL